MHPARATVVTELHPVHVDAGQHRALLMRGLGIACEFDTGHGVDARFAPAALAATWSGKTLATIDILQADASTH